MLRTFSIATTCITQARRPMSVCECPWAGVFGVEVQPALQNQLADQFLNKRTSIRSQADAQ